MLNLPNSFIGVENFFFKSGNSNLYGEVTFPTKNSENKKIGVLISGALGEEDFFISPTISQLAIQLSEYGFTTFKFDFFGFGNSEGLNEEANLLTWQENFCSASEYLLKTYDVKKIIVIGIRLGAMISILAGLRNLGIHSACFWEPIFNGSKYIKEKQRERTTKNLFLSIPYVLDKTKNFEDFMGHNLSNKFIHQIASCVIEASSLNKLENVRIIRSQKSIKNRKEIQNMANLLEETTGNIVLEEINCELFWMNFAVNTTKNIIRSTISWLLQVSNS